MKYSFYMLPSFLQINLPDPQMGQNVHFRHTGLYSSIWEDNFWGVLCLNKAFIVVQQYEHFNKGILPIIKW